jgi:hypothetical protein
MTYQIAKHFIHFFFGVIELRKSSFEFITGYYTILLFVKVLEGFSDIEYFSCSMMNSAKGSMMKYDRLAEMETYLYLQKTCEQPPLMLFF